MSDLFVTDHTPTLGVGRAMRVYAIVKALAALGPVDVLYPRFGAGEPSREFTELPNVRLHGVDSSRGLLRARAFAKLLIWGTPQRIARVASPELMAAANELAPVPGTGRVIGDGMGPRMMLRGLERTHGVILNAHNLESAFQDQLGADKVGSQEQLAKLEKTLFDRSAETWMVSEADVKGTLALSPGASVRYVPNVVDTGAIEPVSGPPEGPIALLVADYTWAPNREAVRFLLEDVLPRVWAELPEARVALVGRGLELPPGTDPRVEPLGFVDSLREQYRRAACAMVPLLTGGGSPLKFVEGLAYGRPVVATPVASKGLERLVPGTHFVLGDGPEGYAAALVATLRDGAPEIAAAGRAQAEREYSVETLVRLLEPGAPIG